jgi:dTDP-4-amino-4,6-dideoxygalactose transaminase
MDSPFRLLVVAEWAHTVWHLFVVRHPQRELLQRQVAKKEIGTLIHYLGPIHESDAYALLKKIEFPIAKQLAAEVLSLPIRPQMNSESVTQAVSAFSSLDPLPLRVQ